MRGDNEYSSNISDGNESVMLASNVKMVEIVENVVPSFVWFEAFESVPVGLGKPRYFFVTGVFGIKKRVDTLENGEAHVFWRNEAVSLGKRQREEVKTGARAIDDSADLGVDDPRQRVTLSDLDDLLASLTIYLVDGAIGALVDPSFKSRFQGWELGYGPIDCGLSV